MSELEFFLRTAERYNGLSRDEILARVLHVDTMAVDHAGRIAPRMKAAARTLLEQLDFEVRARNPGVHYVLRDTYLGYRRERDTGSSAGARSQVFLSVVPKNRYLLLVFVPPAEQVDSAFVREVPPRGHHGVGTAQCSLHSKADLDRFVREMGALLSPR